MKALTVMFVLFVFTMSIAGVINPATDIHSYQLRFTKVTDGVPADAPVYYIGGSMTLQWFMSTETVPYDIQPDPILYEPYTDELIITVDNSLVTQSDQGQEYVYTGGVLTAGEWQVQLRASVLDTDASPLWSKYSNSVPFHVRVPVDPPTAPYSITIKFAR